ncbi:unnamed protein product [Caenorhabditis sp. 36 PRJEB53466]|nr:unnamed protein product [Caenorhabditis sp. 36 PRJEB53466]
MTVRIENYDQYKELPKAVPSNPFQEVAQTGAKTLYGTRVNFELRGILKTESAFEEMPSTYNTEPSDRMEVEEVKATDSEKWKLPREVDEGESSVNRGTRTEEWLTDWNEVSWKERRSRTRRFGRVVRDVEAVEAETRKRLRDMPNVSDREREFIAEPMNAFSRELQKRFEEIGENKWQREVMRVMESAQLETVEQLQELVTSGEARESDESKWRRSAKNSSEYRKLREEYGILQAEMAAETDKLSKAIDRLETEKEALRRRLEKAEKAVKAERKTAEQTKADLLGCQGALAEARRTTERFEGVIDDNIKRSGKPTRDEVRDMVLCMSRMMKVSALPEPNQFDGTGDLGEFKRAFLLKYNHVVEDDEELITILEDRFLKGPAKSLFKTLQGRFCRPVKELFEEFERKLRKRQGDRKTEALNEFDDLSRKPGQMMWEFLVDVEKWSREAYPEVGEETLSQMRTTKLMKAVREDETLHKLLIMRRLEIPLREQYEQLKDVVLQQENERCRDNRQRMSGWKGKEDGSRMITENASQQHSENGVEDVKPNEESRAEENNVRCFRCGGVGHVANYCTSKPVMYVGCRGNGTAEGVMKEAVETIRVLGQARRIIIDSGAVVSVISTRAWERLKKGCRGWEKEVKVLEKPSFSLVNVEKKKMPVEKQLQLLLEIRGRKSKVLFQLVRSEAEILLLGTNAFKSVGVELKWRAEEAGKHEAKLGKRAARLNKIREYHVGNGNSGRERNRDRVDRDGGSRVIVDKVSHKSLGTLATGQLSTAEKLEKEKEIGGRREPKKTVVREADLVIGPRLKFSSPAYFDIKAKADVAWTEKYDWKGVEKVVMLAKWTVDPTENKNRAEIIESIAKDVKELIVVPIRMACKFNEVGGITEWWKKRMRTSTNVRFVDPQTPVGPKQLPMVVVIPEKFDSAEMMGGYLDSLIPRNAAVEKLMVGRNGQLFTASWCGPCQHIYPEVETQSAEYCDQLTFFKIDVDDNEQLVEEFGIGSMPTFVLLIDGQKREQFSGANVEKLRDLVQKAIN